MKKRRLKRRWLLPLLALPTASFATGIESILNNCAHFLQGPLAKAVGILAIVRSGYLCIAKQKLPKEQFVMILVGLGIIFSAPYLYITLMS